jgi:hypothetical protein
MLSRLKIKFQIKSNQIKSKTFVEFVYEDHEPIPKDWIVMVVNNASGNLNNSAAMTNKSPCGCCYVSEVYGHGVLTHGNIFPHLHL